MQVRRFLCLFWRETHTKGLRARFPTRLEEDEGRKVPWRTEETRTEKEAEQRCVQNRGVSRSEQETARICGLRRRVGQRERMSQHSWWFCGNFTRIHACDSSQNARKVSQTSLLLRLEQTQVRICLFSFLPPSRLCMLFCVSVEKCKIPLAGDERNHQTI